MRDFNDADRQKKSKRITLPENPGNLSAEALAKLEAAVKAAAQEAGVPCPTAWRVAKDEGVSRLDVGVAIDRLGIRVIHCQLGCFKFEKTDHLGAPVEPFTEETARRVDDLVAKGALTCANVFALAAELKAKPFSVANAANAKKYKLAQCQLGCF